MAMEEDERKLNDKIIPLKLVFFMEKLFESLLFLYIIYRRALFY